MIVSQTYNVTISGIVTDSNTGNPVLGQEIYIATDSVAGGGFMYFNTVLTDSSGYYEDIMQVPTGEQGMVYVYTMACGIVMTQTGIFSPNMSQLIFDFQVCSDPGGGYCQAMFYYYPGTDSLSIQFLDASLGNPNNWYWEFGDGNSSVEQNPIHIYPEPGEYLTNLTISNDSCTSTMEMIVFVMRDSLPDDDCQAMFYAYADSNSLFTINFMDMSIAGGNPSGIPDTWYWDFGDGNTSTLQNPVHTYLDEGYYQVCLTITGPGSQGSTCESTECQLIQVGNWPNDCQASFRYYPVGDSNNPGGWNSLNIQFIDMSFGDPDSWAWDFGDGTSSNEQNPLHLYANEGNYNVCLSIFNSIDSCESTYCEEVYVYNDTTYGCFAWYEYQINDLTVDFQGYMQGGVNYIEYTWDFGDGATGTGANITHTYAEDGIYNVLLSATDSVGCYAEYMEMIWVGNNFTFEVDGYIYLEDSIMADLAYVHLMTFDTLGQGLINVETTQINDNGYYVFDGVGFENCLYFIQAELTDQSNYYGDYLPTYHLNALTWQEAYPIFPFPTGWTTIDVYMVNANSSNSGSGIITGTVSEEGNRNLLADVEILLLDQEDRPIIYRRTNNEGSFDFSQLAFGTYTVYTEIVGIETIPFEVTLSEQNSSLSVNIFVTNGQAILGIDDINSVYIESIDNIFPNPVTEKSAINIGIKEPSSIKVEIINQYGQSLYSNKVLLSTGKHTVELPTLSLSQGYYLVRITADDNVSVVRKLIKLR